MVFTEILEWQISFILSSSVFSVPSVFPEGKIYFNTCNPAFEYTLDPGRGIDRDPANIAPDGSFAESSFAEIEISQVQVERPALQ